MQNNPERRLMNAQETAELVKKHTAELTSYVERHHFYRIKPSEGDARQVYFCDHCRAWLEITPGETTC